MGDGKEIKGRIEDKREKIYNRDRWLKRKKKRRHRKNKKKCRAYEQRERGIEGNSKI